MNSNILDLLATKLPKDRLAYKTVLKYLKGCSQKKALELNRTFCRTDLFYLLLVGLNRPDINNDWLFDRCREIQFSPDGYLDLWAREYYKSTIITFALTIQEILNDPEITVGIFSHTRPIAKGFLRQIKTELETNTRLKTWFPEILYDDPKKDALKWSEDDGIIVSRETNPNAATVEAYGLVDGMPTSKHYKLMVYDDIVVLNSVTSPEMIEKTMAAVEMSYNLSARGGRRRFIGTHYHYNDPYTTLIKRESVVPRVYPATHDGTLTGTPVLLTQQQLDDKRRDMGMYTYSCQMLQNPIADSSQGFRREWIKNTEILSLENLNWYLLIDSANAKRKTNDYTSIWAVGLGEDGNYYCIPEVRDRLNITERSKRLIELHRKYRPIEVRYERYGLMADIEYIKRLQEEQNYRFDIIEVAGQTPKDDRIKRLVPLFENGILYLPITHMVTDYEGKTRDLVSDFIEQEYVPFPVSAHKDMLDSLSRIAEPKRPLTWPSDIDVNIAETYSRASAW